MMHAIMHATRQPFPYFSGNVFINFARVIVPLRIALALALAPWCERNIIEKFFPAKVPDECEV